MLYLIPVYLIINAFIFGKEFADIRHENAKTVSTIAFVLMVFGLPLLLICDLADYYTHRRTNKPIERTNLFYSIFKK